MEFSDLVDRTEDLQADLAAIPSSASKIDRVRREQELIGDYMADLAEAVSAGDVSKTEVPPLFGAIKEEAETYNKTELKGLFREKLETADEEADERPPFDEWLDEHLTRVLIVETTDESRPVTTYRWDFGDVSVETERDPQSGVTHLSWSAFRERVYEAVSHDFAPPEASEAEAWRAWIEPLVSDRGVEREAVGARTQALEYLSSDISASVGYLTPSDAISRGGVWVDAHDGAVDDDAAGTVALSPDDVDAIGVPTPTIRTARDEGGAGSFRAVQLEAEARGVSAASGGGISRVKRVGDDSERFWMLDPEWVMPSTVRVSGREAGESVGAPSEPPAATGSSTAGVSGTIGVDPDAETDGGDATGDPTTAATGDASDATDDGGDGGD